MDSIRKVRIKHEDGSYSESIPIGANSDDIAMSIGGTLTDNIKDIEQKVNNIKVSNDNQTVSINNLITTTSKHTIALTEQQTINENQQRQIDAFQKALTQEKIYIFNSVAEMKNSNKIIDGMYCVTKGYYEPNDGGGAKYLIKTSSSFYYEELKNNLVAELLIVNNTINLKQLGGKPQDKDGKYDNKIYLEKYFTILNTAPTIYRRLKLYIPNGVWCFTKTSLFYAGGFYIYGGETFTGTNREVSGTIITSLNDNQDMIWEIGKTTEMQQNVVIKNLFISSLDYQVLSNNKVTNTNLTKIITDTAFRIQRTQYLISDNLIFSNIGGQALGITTSWELYFKLLNFRGVFSTGSILNFENTIPGIDNANISACNFEKIMFEGFLGNLINFSEKCGFGHNNFGIINIEDFQASTPDKFGINNIPVNDNTDFSIVNDFTRVFNFETNVYLNCVYVDSILINNFGHFIKQYKNKNYLFDTIIRPHRVGHIDFTINNIQCIGILKDCNITYTENDDEGFVSLNSIISINNVYNYNTSHKMFFNFKGGFNGRLMIDNINLKNSLPGAESIKNNTINLFDDAYKLIANRYLPRGIIYYCDDNTFNSKMLCVKPLKNTEGSDLVFLRILTAPKTLKIRAKIKNGEVATIGYGGTEITTTYIQLNGTGDFQWYTLYSDKDFSDKEITLNSINLTTDCYIDCVKYF